MQRRTLSDANSAHSPRPRSTARWDFSVAGDEEQLQSKDGGLRGAERHERPWLQPRRPEAVSSSGVRYPLGRTSAESAWSPSERAADRQAAVAGTLSPRPSPAADSVFTTSPQAAGRGPKLCMEPRHFSESDAATTVHQRHLPSATVHDPSWHPGRLKCYSLHDRVNRNAVEHSFRDESRDETDWDVLHQDQEHVAEQAACSVNLDYLRQCLEQFAISHSTRFEVRLESCGHSRPSFSLRGVPVSSQPIIGTRYEKYAERLANMIHEINEWTTREWKADVVGYSRLLPVLSFHRNEPQCMSPLGAKERRTTGEPRIGSFEVVVAVCRDDCDDLKEFTLWSKLDSHAFPNMALLKDELMGLLQLTLDRMRGAERIQAIQRRCLLRRKYLQHISETSRARAMAAVALKSAARRSVIRRRYLNHITGIRSNLAELEQEGDEKVESVPENGGARPLVRGPRHFNRTRLQNEAPQARPREEANTSADQRPDFVEEAGQSLKSAARRSLLRRRYIDRIVAARRETVAADQEATMALDSLNEALRRSVLRRRYIDRVVRAVTMKNAVRRSIYRFWYVLGISAAATVKNALRRSVVRRQYLDRRIEISIWMCGSKEKITLPAFSDSTVQSVKQDFMLKTKREFIMDTAEPISNPAGLLLVCCGQVLKDNATSADLTTHLKHGERVWAVFRDVWQASPIEPEEYVLFQSIFAFPAAVQTACTQDKDFCKREELCWKTFQKFCKCHGFMEQAVAASCRDGSAKIQTLTWRPQEEEQKCLIKAVQAFEMGSKSWGHSLLEQPSGTFPQVRCFADYGCALAVSRIDESYLSLQVLSCWHARPMPSFIRI